jgi:hypothetical protein
VTNTTTDDTLTEPFDPDNGLFDPDNGLFDPDNGLFDPDNGLGTGGWGWWVYRCNIIFQMCNIITYNKV